MKNKKIISFFMSFIIIVMFNLMVYADVGGIQRYDGSTEYDYSSNDFSFDSNYSSSNDYSSNSSFWSDSDSMDYIDSDDDGLIDFLFSPAGIITIIILVMVFGKKNNSVQYTENYQRQTPTVTYNVAEKVREVDENFSEEQFLTEVKEVFVKLQNAWTARDWKVIRPFESNELFQIHSTQLQEFIDNGKINVVERIAVQRASLKSFIQDGDKETLKVDLDAVMRDYIIDEKTKEVLEGSKEKDQYMKYTLTFIRKAGVKTQAGNKNIDTTNCPNCGAPTEITSAGQCEYCGSVITTGEHDWVLSALEGRR